MNTRRSRHSARSATASGPNNMAKIAPALAAVLRSLISGTTGTAKGFRGGFQRGLLG